MTGRPRKRIYVFEQEAGFRDLLENSLAPQEASVSGFSQHLECIAEIAIRPCDLLIVDWDGCPAEGLNVIEQARRLTPWMSSLAIVEHAAVDKAIRAMRAGAQDCFDKPVPQDRLLTAVRTQLARVDFSARRRPRALTQMEVQILQLILAGRTSYEIADGLHRSKRTIDVHRKNIMRKLQATGLVDLIKRALGMGFANPQVPTGDKPGPEEDRPGPPAAEPA
ncbi:MAG: LuxR C-terminal-related transcriptional regulator [Planctomycetes bacterium]|nr:LuxR C-terminal-related transcriptional regulator [Planctomycetota bacterium]